MELARTVKLITTLQAIPTRVSIVLFNGIVEKLVSNFDLRRCVLFCNFMGPVHTRLYRYKKLIFFSCRIA
jgi:hypothetical protein